MRTALHLPETLRARATTPAVVPNEAKELALKSLEKGYLKDALRYLTIAHENDPVDFEVMLKLGWANNMLKDDRDAIKWFNLARQSPDVKIAVEAARASHNLSGSLARFRTTVWVFPTFSTRWHDLFAYAQAKTDLNLHGWFAHPYLTLRFVGDTKGAVSARRRLRPPISFRRRRHLRTRHRHPHMARRNRLVRSRRRSYATALPPPIPAAVRPTTAAASPTRKGFGHLLTGESHGWFAETNDDAVYVRRFENDTLLYSQNRTGYTALRAQFYWNWNVTTDVKTLYWANYVETGPGLRIRIAPLLFSVNLLRGVYLVNAGNPRGPNFNDLRIGVWYAFSR